jgi:hypothetical protein
MTLIDEIKRERAERLMPLTTGWTVSEHETARGVWFVFHLDDVHLRGGTYVDRRRALLDALDTLDEYQQRQPANRDATVKLN